MGKDFSKAYVTRLKRLFYIAIVLEFYDIYWEDNRINIVELSNMIAQWI